MIMSIFRKLLLNFLAKQSGLPSGSDIMHLTSVLKPGKNATKQDIHLQMSRTFNLNIRTKWQLEDSNTASSRFGILVEPL
jgi:hypothetical protein